MKPQTLNPKPLKVSGLRWCRVASDSPFGLQLEERVVMVSPSKVMVYT